MERACGLRGRSQWGRKAAAHAEFFSLLTDVADDPLLVPLLTGGAAYVREVMLAVGRAADGMIVSSRRRLLAHMRAGDGEGAALEMERHLRGLLYMWRLALPGSKAAHERGSDMTAMISDSSPGARGRMTPRQRPPAGRSCADARPSRR